jgi:hypothetical protein
VGGLLVIDAKFHEIANLKVPTLKSAGFGLNDCVSASHRYTKAIWRHLCDPKDNTFRVEVGHVDSKFHPDRMDPCAWLEYECSMEVVASDQAAAAVSSAFGKLNGCKNSTVADQPWHPRSVPCETAAPAASPNV